MYAAIVNKALIFRQFVLDIELIETLSEHEILMFAT